MSRAALVCLLAGCGRIDFDAVRDGGGIDGPVAPLTVTKLEIYDPDIDKPVADVTNGGSLVVTPYPNGITVVATVSGMPGSVEFVRPGHVNVEASAPFASNGDFNNNDLRRDEFLVVGKTSLMVTAYELADRAGAKGAMKSVEIELVLPLSVSPQVVRAGFIDDNGSGFIQINDGQSYSVGSLPASADLRVETDPAYVGSVVIGGVGPWADGDATENFQPYTAMGLGGAFTPMPGTYTLTARAFPLGRGKGEPGAMYSVTFQIVP